jgi:helix-turn-helix protein
MPGISHLTGAAIFLEIRSIMIDVSDSGKKLRHQSKMQIIVRITKHAVVRFSDGQQRTDFNHNISNLLETWKDIY